MDSSSSFFDYPNIEPAEEASTELALLADATEEDWTKLLEYTEMRRFSPGDLVVAGGEADRALYLLTDGRLRVELSGERAAQGVGTAIEAPAVVGEVAFLDGRRRSASLRARTEGEVLRLSWESFEALSARDPCFAREVLLDVSRIVAARLRKANRLVGDGTL